MPFILKSNGTTVDRVASQLYLTSLHLDFDGGTPQLEFEVRPTLFGGPPYSFLNKTITLDYDNGTTTTRVFSGYSVSVSQQPGNAGFIYRYTCEGLKYLGDTVPHTDSNTGSDRTNFNLSPDDPNYVASRAGRSLGQILTYCLEDEDNKTNLDAVGIGNYVSLGSGATATATLSGTGVASCSVTSGGSNYSTAPLVSFVGGGGTGATATASVSAGAVTSISVGSPGSGYTSAPQVVLSTLPAITQSDLDALTLIPPHPITVQGEKLLGALDSVLRQCAPNHALVVDPDGNIRFIDRRGFGSPKVVFSGGGGSGAKAHCVTTAGVVTSVVVDIGGSGYTTAPTAVVIGIGTEATVTPHIFAGAVSSVSVDTGGSGYVNSITLEDGVDPFKSPTFSRDCRDSFSRVIVRGQANVEGVQLTLAPPAGSSQPNGGIEEYFAHDGLTSSNAKTYWKSSDFTNPTTSGGQAKGTAHLTSGTVSSITLDFSGYSYASAPPVKITGAGTGATATCTLGTGGNADKVASFTVTAGGSGYGTTVPTVTVGPPNPGNADAGSCTCLSTTTVRVTSADTQKIWAADYWDQTSSGHLGTIYLSYDIGIGATAVTSRRIIANTALTAGGTSDLTLDLPLDITSYNYYRIAGVAGGASIVWRKYHVVDSAIASKLQQRFNYPVPYVSSDGQAATMTSTPVGIVEKGGQEVSLSFIIDSDAGTLLFERPLVTVFGSPANLALGGASTDGIPDDVRVLLPVAKGALEITLPTDVSGSPVYDGTSYTEDGISRTLTITVPDWRDPGQTTNMTIYAQEMLDSVKDSVVEGTIEYVGLVEDFLYCGQAINLTNSTGTLGFESAELPLRAVDVSFGQADQIYRTNLHVSNRKAQYTAPTLSPLPVGPNFSSSSEVADMFSVNLGGTVYGGRQTNSNFGTDS